MSSDRQHLADLVRAIDAGHHTRPESLDAITDRVNAARVHLATTEPDEQRASRAAYAAGAASQQ